ETGSFDVQMELGLDDLEPEVAAGLIPSRVRGNRVTAKESEKKTIPAPSSLASRLRENFSCEGAATVTAEADLGPTVDARLNSAQFTVGVDQSSSASIEISGNGQCALKRTAVFDEPLKFKKMSFFVGPVPVVLAPEVQVFVDADGTVSASARAGFEQSFEA